MSVHLKPSHLQIAAKFVAKADANGGLAPIDLRKFWEAQAIAIQDSFSDTCPQVPMAIDMSIECAFDELNETPDFYRSVFDPDYVQTLARRYNDKAEQIVGKRIWSEILPDPERQWPKTRMLYDIFEARNVWYNESYWLQSSTHDEDELKALLDRVEKRLENLRAFVLPDNWEGEKARLIGLGEKVPSYRYQRGPVTFAMSVYGVEKLIFTILDNPELAGRYRDLILKAMLEYARVFDLEGGHTPETRPKGFSWADDNCALLTAEMYEFFAVPIIRGVFDEYAPGEKDKRFQHSDSDMGHLLTQLNKLGMRAVNFGPNLTVAQIREQMPKAIIYGQLAPFTFSRNEEVNIVAEFLRDFEMAREQRGLQFATAGSVNHGSRLTGLRLIMAAIQEFGQY